MSIKFVTLVQWLLCDRLLRDLQRDSYQLHVISKICSVDNSWPTTDKTLSTYNKNALMSFDKLSSHEFLVLLAGHRNLSQFLKLSKILIFTNRGFKFWNCEYYEYLRLPGEFFFRIY